MIECTRRVRFFYICMAHFNADFDGISIKNRVEWKTGCVSDEINRLCHTNEDNYMMELLSKITSKAIKKGIVEYDELYYITEKELIRRLDKDKRFDKLLKEFREIKKEDIKETDIPNLKMKLLNPLVKNKRIN